MIHANVIAPPAQGFGARAWLARLASLRLTAALLALLGASIGVAYALDWPMSWPVAVPLMLMAANLAASIATQPGLRRSPTLLAFHLALLALALLVAAGRLTYLRGTLELTEGEAFDGTLVHTEAGPWHASRLAEARFANLGFDIDYAPGLKRDATKNRLLYVDADGRERRAVIGDNVPLRLAGYRFYTSHNKGFAPAFVWHPDGGAPQFGSVHLPAYPAHEYQQAREWRLPGSNTQVWTQLQFDEVLLDPSQATSFRLPARHTLIVRVGETRHELAPGESIALPGGRLEYAGLRAWMGYTVFSDWTLPWIAAAALVAVLAMGAHFWRRHVTQPWEPGHA